MKATVVPAAATLLAIASAFPATQNAPVDHVKEARAAQCPGQLPGTVLSPTSTVSGFAPRVTFGVPVPNPLTHARALQYTVSKKAPNAAFPPTNNLVSFTPNDLGTVINFIIPEAAANKTCSLYFSLPAYDELNYAPDYYFNGPGNFHFYDFAYPPTPPVSYDSLPPTAFDLGTVNLQPGRFYHLSSLPCPVGPISGVTFGIDSTLIYYQEQNSLRCPVGLFTTYE